MIAKYEMTDSADQGADFYEDGKWLRPDEVLDRLNQLDALRQSADEVTLRVACVRLGRFADGQETSRDNILGRIDELRWAESDREILRNEIARHDRYRMSCACQTGDCPHNNQRDCVECQVKTIEEQAAYIAVLESKLRRTADGVVVGSGDRVYPAYPLTDGLDPDESADIDDSLTIVLAGRCNLEGCHYIEGDGLDIKENYSTREAALAARKEQP